MVKLTAKAKEPNFLGRLGENNFAVIRFPESAAVFAEIPDAQVMLLHQRPGDPAAYPVNPDNVRIDGGVVEWTIHSGDLAVKGDGFAQLVFSQDNVVAKTLIYHTRIGNALDGSGNPPEPWESWQQQVSDDADRAEAAAELLEHPEAEAETLPYGTPATANYSNGKFFFGIPEGEKGDQGDPGAPGKDGKDGADGKDGKDGSDYEITPADYQAIAEDVAQNAGFQQLEDAVEGMAYGTKDGSPVSSDSPYYENNAYYWMTICRALTGKYPRIGSNGNWEIWNATTEQWVDTETPATGDDGVSPTITISSITGGHRVTITDATGDHSFDVMDGQTPTVPVQDVQVNGVSVLNQGVANVPVASDSTYGVIKGSSTYGIYQVSSGIMGIANATSAQIKGSTGSYRPITPSIQNASAFYGLAKAAGDSTQSASSNAVGTYTEAAKVAIQKMLGVYQAPWELIREDTVTNATEADIEITVDGNGNAFELTDVAIAFETPKQDTASSLGGSGNIRFYYGESSYIVAWVDSWTQAANANAIGTYGIVENKGKLIQIMSMQRNSSVVSNLRTNWAGGLSGNNMGIQIIDPFIVSKVVIRQVTGTGHYKLYGKRKWN